jgi:hypothetical protein
VVLVYDRDCVDPRAIVRLEGLNQLKNRVVFAAVLLFCLGPILKHLYVESGPLSELLLPLAL